MNIIEEAKRLRTKGLSYRAIGTLMQVDHSTVIYWLKESKGKVRFPIEEGSEVICSNCKRSYVKDRKKGHKGILCNSCSSRVREKKIKEEVVNIIGDTCVVCGYNKCKSAIEFHHVNSENKLFSLSQKRSTSLNSLKEEALKCIPLCSNCHRELHSGLIELKDISIKYLKEYQLKLINEEIGRRLHITSIQDNKGKVNLSV